MKTILYMAISANGYIAKENDDVSFVSKNSWSGYKKAIEQVQSVIIGKRTYDIMPNEEFDKDKLYIVITHKENVIKKTSKIRFTNSNPKEIITSLKKEGINNVLISGGSQINSLFMKENLIDEIYLDVEPIVFGKGIKLFADESFESKLALIETKNISKDEIQLHYKVIK